MGPFDATSCKARRYFAHLNWQMQFFRGLAAVRHLRIVICHFSLSWLAITANWFFVFFNFSSQASMYFAVVVMSTVGLGDICPRTFAGRVLTVVWIVLRSYASPDIPNDILIREAPIHCADMIMLFSPLLLNVLLTVVCSYVKRHPLCSNWSHSTLNRAKFAWNKRIVLTVFTPLMQPRARYHALRHYILQFWDVGTSYINARVQAGHVFLPYWSTSLSGLYNSALGFKV